MCRAYADGGAHDGQNGLELRTDLHRLFDRGYVTIDELWPGMIQR